jgi:predicted outer membrane repeat protein
MDFERFDRMTRMLGAGLTRRTGLRAAAAALIGATASLDGEAGEARGRGEGHGRERGQAGGPGAAGPCGDGSVKANRCKKGSDCCTGHCNTAKRRCRCLQRGKSCKTDANCCGTMTCTKKKCTQPPKPVPTGKACGPKDTCASDDATCTTYEGGSPAGTYCLLPYLTACTASNQCETSDCGGGKCISCSCEGCGGTCTPIVCPTCTHQTVQAAIDAAAAGDIITIAPGTYAEDLSVSKTITLKGCPGGDVILMNVTVPGRTIMVSEGFDLTLIDVIVDASSYQGAPNDNGGIDAMGNVTMCRNAVVRNAYRVSGYDGGGGIQMGRVAPGGITLTMNDQTVVENCTTDHDGHYGGGVYLDSYAHMVMNDSSVVRNNTIPSSGESGGAGVGIYIGADLVMNDMARITGNHSTQRTGGGVKVYSGGGIPYVLQMNDQASIDNNTSGWQGGGVHLVYGNSDNLDAVKLSGSATIANNTSDSYAGGIALEGGVITLADSASITGNSAPYAGGIYSQGGAAWTAAHSVVLSGEATVSGNTVDSYGGGIYADGALILVEDSAMISGNTAGKDGGGVYMKLRYQTNSTLEITGSATISGNTAAQGGGVFAVDNNQTVTGAAAITGNTPDNCVGATGC